MISLFIHVVNHLIGFKVSISTIALDLLALYTSLCLLHSISLCPKPLKRNTIAPFERNLEPLCLLTCTMNTFQFQIPKRRRKKHLNKIIGRRKTSKLKRIPLKHDNKLLNVRTYFLHLALSFHKITQVAMGMNLL